MLEAAGAVFPIVTAGEGEPVLFVHGVVGDYRKWDGLWEDVADGHRFMAYTQRWFGTTAWPDDKPYARDVQDDDLVAILQALGEPVHLMGLSNGGPVALRAALRVPDLVRSVVIYEANLQDVLFGTAEGRAAVGEFVAGVARHLHCGAGGRQRGGGPRAHRVDLRLAGGRVRHARSGAEGDGAGQCAHHAADVERAGPDAAYLRRPGHDHGPVLVINGAETLPLWQVASKAVAECVPNAQLAMIEGVGHNGPVAAKDAFVKLLLGFVDAH